MIPGKLIWKPLIQKAVIGKASRFHMSPRKPEWPVKLISPGLYIHVPFCKNLCPYCPYNRVEYDEALFSLYEKAIKQEIDLYAPYLHGITFSSLYIGGGTPTVNWRGLINILDYLRNRINLSCDICIELHPANMENDCLMALKDIGITMLSIGVESTSDVLLDRIKRSHDGKTAMQATERALITGFKSVNADLMFAFPGESLAEWQNDVRNIVNLGVDQLSTYPMFSFPYSELGKTKGIHNVERPPHRAVKAMLDFTEEYAVKSGLDRCAVWSWLKPKKLKFSSITRHHYVGLGPSSASMTGNDFYVNTFDVKAYSQCLPAERPIALSMEINKRIEMAYWLYWRIYELKILNDDFQEIFGEDSNLDEEYGNLFLPLISMGMLTKGNGGYHVTKSGAYWIHRLQNEYSLNYINRLWGACRKKAWPQSVLL